ncbi:MAG: cytochrome c [Thermoflavifilum sp.]|nr:cytochrome c [Thermoflavifilum sp.]
MLYQRFLSMIKNFLLLTLPNIIFLNLKAQQITFYPRVAKIIHEHCTTCHRPGESAPFNLISYQDVAKRAHFILQVISTGYMPPWKPDTTYTRFCGERTLSTFEIQLIKKWISDGMPEGNSHLQEDTMLDRFIPNTLYNRKPDLILSMKKPYLIRGDNTERFVFIKLPFELDTPENVEAVEFVANHLRYIHHVNYAIYPATHGEDIYQGGQSATLGEDSSLAFQQFDPFVKGNEPMIHYGGWIPGTSYEYFPENIGFVLPKKGVVILSFHFAPSPIDTPVIGSLHFFFKKSPIQREIQTISIGSGGIGNIMPPLVILPNQIDSFEVTAQTTENISLLAVWPHMHLLGKSFLAYAITPLQDTIPLIKIPHWDFNWQDIYRFRKMIHLPAGSIVYVKGVYDNTSDNPRNPFQPPRIIFGDNNELMKTTDEMLTLILLYVKYKSGDENHVVCK